MSETVKKVKEEESRELMPIFVHSEVDELGLTVNAFRVYGHLARRAGSSNYAWPSYASIGRYCFRSSYPNAQESTLRRKALAAVKELKDVGLLEVQERTIPETKGNMSNAYRLVSLSKWRKLREQAKRRIRVIEDEDLPF
jgi:hypothetical protein